MSFEFVRGTLGYGADDVPARERLPPATTRCCCDETCHDCRVQKNTKNRNLELSKGSESTARGLDEGSEMRGGKKACKTDRPRSVLCTSFYMRPPRLQMTSNRFYSSAPSSVRLRLAQRRGYQALALGTASVPLFSLSFTAQKMRCSRGPHTNSTHDSLSSQCLGPRYSGLSTTEKIQHASHDAHTCMLHTSSSGGVGEYGETNYMTERRRPLTPFLFSNHIVIRLYTCGPQPRVGVMSITQPSHQIISHAHCMAEDCLRAGAQTIGRLCMVEISSVHR